MPLAFASFPAACIWLVNFTVIQLDALIAPLTSQNREGWCSVTSFHRYNLTFSSSTTLHQAVLCESNEYVRRYVVMYGCVGFSIKFFEKISVWEIFRCLPFGLLPEAEHRQKYAIFIFGQFWTYKTVRTDLF